IAGVVMRLGIAGPESHGAAVALDRLAMAAQREQRVPAVVLGFRQIGVDRERALEAGLGFLEPPQRLQGIAEPEKRRRGARLARERLPHERFGLASLSALRADRGEV